MHRESNGSVLCGMRGNMTTEPDLVDCKRCLRMMDRVTIRVVDPTTQNVVKATVKRMVNEVVSKGAVFATAKPKPGGPVAPKPSGVVVKGIILKEEKPPVVRVPKVFPMCACGCKDEEGNRQFTKGGKYRPGHDAKHHSALKGPKPSRVAKVRATAKPKPERTGDHLIDTTLGMVRRMNDDQVATFMREANKRYGLGVVTAIA